MEWTGLYYSSVTRDILIRVQHLAFSQRIVLTFVIFQSHTLEKVITFTSHSFTAKYPNISIMNDWDITL
jgi:hypothetical protein